MELLKSKVIIDENYRPSLDLDYMEFFNRAMVFAQTNYKEELERVTKLNFRKLSPTVFFEEYVWSVCCTKQDVKEVSLYFEALKKAISPYMHSFWDLNSFPKEEQTKEAIVALCHSEDKFKAIHHCASIINRGIKLFTWEKYRNNFLNTPEKLSVLPMLGINGANHLFSNITVSSDVVKFPRLYDLAKHWGFSSATELYMEINKRIVLPLRIIELILWYASDELIMKA